MRPATHTTNKPDLRLVIDVLNSMNVSVKDGKILLTLSRELQKQLSSIQYTNVKIYFACSKNDIQKGKIYFRNTAVPDGWIKLGLDYVYAQLKNLISKLITDVNAKTDSNQTKQIDFSASLLAISDNDNTNRYAIHIKNEFAKWINPKNIFWTSREVKSSIPLRSCARRVKLSEFKAKCFTPSLRMIPEEKVTSEENGTSSKPGLNP